MSPESQDKIESQSTASPFNFTTGAAFSVLKESITQAFWQPVIDLFNQSKKHLIKPAILLLSGPCIIMAGFYFGSLGINGTIEGFGPIIQYLICFSIGSIGGIVCITWSISEWLFKLTAFSRSLQNGQTMQESIDYLKTRKGFLFVSWFIYGLLMTPCILVLIASSILAMMQMPILQPLVLPDYITVPAEIMSGLALIFSTMYALLLIAVSGITDSSGTKAALTALAGTFKTCIPLLIYAILANIIFCITIEIVFTVVSLQMTFQNYIPGLWEQVAIIFSSSILRGIASFFVLPFLIAVPAEITKRAIRN
ncbi:MAG: hypothetical protein SFY67_03880 [Candidatus Melainabacteria bacterium]|nr:hypothetical protein [Candidatus Melainabacteria bacterium]